VAVVLTVEQTKQIRINIHKGNNKKYSINNTKHGKYKYTYYQNTHTIVKTPSYTLIHTLKNKLNQTQNKIHTQMRVIIHSTALSIRSP
jgi:hypothetical protein